MAASTNADSGTGRWHPDSLNAEFPMIAFYAHFPLPSRLGDECARALDEIYQLRERLESVSPTDGSPA